MHLDEIAVLSYLLLSRRDHRSLSIGRGQYKDRA